MKTYVPPCPSKPNSELLRFLLLVRVLKQKGKVSQLLVAI